MKVVNCVAQITKQTKKHTMQGGYSEYGLCVKFSTEIQVSLHPKELSLDEATIPWWGRLKFRTYNPGKTKYGALVRMVCEVVLGCLSKMKIHTDEK
jgi:hypothetical protein